MAQTFEQLQDGVTKFRYLYNLIQSNFNTIKSQFSGTTAPVSPVNGQCWYNTADQNMYQYKVDSLTGIGYWDNTSPTELQDEITTARGTAATLDARLSIGINDDGTFKESVPVTANTWIVEENTITYLTSSTFKIAGDVRAVYVSDRAISLTQNTSAIMYVDTATLSGEDTIIAVKGGTVDTGLSQVEYSTLVKENQPYIDVDVSGKANTDLDNITTAGTSVITSLIASNITGKANTDLDNVSDTGKETVVGWGMPDYSAGVSQVEDVEYTAPRAGILYINAQDYNTDTYITIDGERMLVQHIGSNQASNSLATYLIDKGTTYTVEFGRVITGQYITFYPLKGVN